MPNLYGVDNGITNPGYAFLIGAADVAVSAGVETTVISIGPLIAPSPGFFIPMVQTYFLVSMGATPPSGMQVAIRNQGGSDIQSNGFSPLPLIANANVLCNYLIWGMASDQLYRPPGTTIQITLNAVSQAVTARFAGGYNAFWLARAADQ